MSQAAAEILQLTATFTCEGELDSEQGTWCVIGGVSLVVCHWWWVIGGVSLVVCVWGKCFALCWNCLKLFAVLELFEVGGH